MKRYEECVTRFEHRWEYPPTKEYADQYVKMALDTGCESVWHSAVTNSGIPLFPSKVYPNAHPRASFEVFHYMIDKFHEIGRPVISWCSLQGSEAVAKAHPEWRAKFFNPDQIKMESFELHLCPQSVTDVNHCTMCFNSPYGKLLPRFAAEIVRDVRFDGIYFDASTISSHVTYPVYLPACQCGYCQERFENDTCNTIPTYIDVSDPVVRCWIEWRYDILIEAWGKVVQAVEEVNPRATVVFNNYRRRSHAVFGWNVAIPLRRNRLNAVLGTELDGFPHQADVQIKINKAYCFAKGVETWWPMVDSMARFSPDQDPTTIIQASLSAMSAGGNLSCGIAMDPTDVTHLMKPLQDHAGLMMQYVHGEDISYIAILASQHRMDFHGKIMDAWDEIHGAAEFCRQSQLPYQVIFDDYLNEDDLLVYENGLKSPRYPIMIAPNAVCIGIKSAQALMEYVEAGGYLIGTCDIGLKDETGEEHGRPILDDLFGIQSRKRGQGFPTLELNYEMQSLCTGNFSLSTYYISTLPGHVLPNPYGNVEILGMISDQSSDTWDGDGYEGASKAPRSAGLLRNRYGKGSALYFGCEFFRSFLQAPSRNGRRFLHALLQNERPAPISVDAYTCLSVNVRRQGKTFLIFLHNIPGTSHRYPVPANRNYLYGTGEVVPIRKVIVHIDAEKLGFDNPEKIEVTSGVSDIKYKFDGQKIVVDQVKLHEVLVIRQCQ